MLDIPGRPLPVHPLSLLGRGRSISFIRAFPAASPRARARRMQLCVIRHDLCFLHRHSGIASAAAASTSGSPALPPEVPALAHASLLSRRFAAALNAGASSGFFHGPDRGGPSPPSPCGHCASLLFIVGGLVRREDEISLGCSAPRATAPRDSPGARGLDPRWTERQLFPVVFGEIAR